MDIRKWMRRLLCLVIFCAALGGALPVWAAASSGTFGDNLTWKVKNNVLTIGGKGEMPDYAGEMREDGGTPIYPSPWKPYRESVTKIVVGDGITVIGKASFYDFSKAKDIVIGKGVKEIRTLAFAELWSLEKVTIPDNVTYIEDSAFSECGYIKSIYIGKGLKTITGETFGSGNLKEITVSDKNPYLCDEDNVIFNKKKTELLMGRAKWREYEIPKTVKKIAPYAFWDGNLSKVTLPDGLKEIGELAFGLCQGLEGVHIPSSVKKIGDKAFFRCGEYMTQKNGKWVSGTFDLVLEEGIKEIGKDAFYKCSILTLVIPSGVSIGDNAFEECHDLTEVTIEDGVTKIGEEAFIGCNSLKKVFVPASVTQIGREAFGYNYDDEYNHVKGKKLSLVGYKKSAAESYAKENEIPFTKVSLPGKISSASVENQNTGVKISWKKASKASGYMIERRTGNGKYQEIGTVKSSVTKWTDETAKNGKTYTYRIKPLRDNEGIAVEGTAKETKSIAFLTCPKAPSLASKKSGQMTVSWKKNKKASGYQIQYAKKTSFKGAASITIKKNTVLTRTVKNLSKGKTIYVRMRSYIKNKTVTSYSSWSPAAKVSIRRW